MPILLPPLGATDPNLAPFGFTTSTLINALYGQLGYDNVMDDVGGADQTNVENQFIIDAEQTIIVRIGKFFETSSLVTSIWIRSRATWIAAYLISKRRGNEHYFEDLYEQAMRELDAMATGEIPPLFEIPLRADLTPSMSNLIIDDRWYSEKIRVKPFISVGQTYAGQDISFYGGLYGWL